MGSVATMKLACVVAVLVSGVVLCAAADEADATQCVIRIGAGDEELGVYYIGDGTADSGYESLVDVVQPGAAIAHTVAYGHSFVLRTSSHKYRVQVKVRANDEVEHQANHPYKLGFLNLMHEGGKAELKHSSSGYMWLDSGEHIEHMTHVRHEFELRNLEHKLKATVMLTHFE